MGKILEEDVFQDFSIPRWQGFLIEKYLTLTCLFENNVTLNAKV